MDARVLLTRLLGQTIHTLGNRRPNRVLALRGDSVIVGTEKSPAGEPVPIASVQKALDRLLRDGEIPINVQSVGYRSAFIGAVLGTVGGVEVLRRPLRVKLRSGAAPHGQ